MEAGKEPCKWCEGSGCSWPCLNRSGCCREVKEKCMTYSKCGACGGSGDSSGEGSPATNHGGRRPK